MSSGIRPLVAAATLTALGAMAVGCKDIITPEPRTTPATDVATSVSRVIVTPDSMHGWVFVDDQRSVACTDTVLCNLTLGPGVPPLGTGSAELAAPTSGDGTALILSGYRGTRLDQITELSYSTYRQTADGGNNLAVALQLTTDFDLADGSNAWQGRLVFEPYHASSGQVVQSSWQTWNTKAGKWWGTRATVVQGGVSTANPCVQSSPCTWSQLLNIFPNAGIHATYGSVILKAGSGWSGFRGNVDALALGTSASTTTYDFELNPAPPSVDDVPAWFADDSSYSEGGFMKGVIGILFRPSASASARQAAIQSIGSVRVGTLALNSGNPIAWVRLAATGPYASADSAIAALEARSDVNVAYPMMRGGPGYLRPHDGAGWSEWAVSPDRIPAGDQKWSLEEIRAPLAWGCSTGSPTTRVAVADFGWQQNEAIESIPAADRPTLNTEAGSPMSHGSLVASILASPGNNGTGITGMMWSSRLRVYDFRMFRPTWDMMARAVAYAGRDGARIVNLSQQATWYTRGATEAEIQGVKKQAKAMVEVILQELGSAEVPLIVTIAGNDNGVHPEASWSPPAVMGDYLPGHVLVVGASTPQHLRWSASGTGSYVDIFAPGGPAVWGELGNVPVGTNGTSMAAPLVAGVAGLILAFDSTLTIPDVRDDIINGSIRAGRSVSRDVVGSGTAPLLDAYGALRETARRPSGPLCGNRVWVDDMGNLKAQRGVTTELLGTTSSQPGSFLYVAHGGRRVLYSTPQSEGFFEWDQATRHWGASATAFWDLPESVWNNVYGYTRAEGWDHDRTRFADVSGGSIRITTVAPYPQSWTVGRMATPGNSALVVFERRSDLPWNTYCYAEYNNACYRQEEHLTGAPAVVQLDTLYPVIDQSSGQAAFGMFGDSIYATLIPVTRTETLEDAVPCPGGKIVDGVQVSICRSTRIEYVTAPATIQSVRAAGPTDNSPTASPHVLAWSTDTLGGWTPRWITDSENGEELVIGVAHRTGTEPANFQYSDCTVLWLDKHTGHELYSLQSTESCFERGIGTVAPMIATTGTITIKRPRAQKDRSLTARRGRPSIAPSH